ncbi:WG repeat-containing protein [Spirosoma spitsbergense]|uniref:WG repeat-containing protein n=1 Tax=Spirosoma spitsbergense TaxID=431554 RepID=UPI00036015CB|nr:WG repeat-containing protein [Spirosoma spitsbergense]
MNSNNPATALVKTTQSLALARVSSQLALTEKLLAKSEEPFLIPYRKGDKWGFCDRNKNIVIDCVYESEPSPFQNGIALIKYRSYLNDKKVIAINKSGEQIWHGRENIIHERNFPFVSNGLLAFCHKQKCSFMNQQGSIILPFECDSIIPFQDNLSYISSSEYNGFINNLGECVLRDINRNIWYSDNSCG